MSYCDSADVKDMYGQTNIEKWADLDSDQDAVKIAARIDRAIEWADNEIDTLLRNSIYTIPFDEENVPPTIVTLSATLAGVNLYESRGVQDYNPETGQAVHRLMFQKDRSYETIRQILAGQRVLDSDVDVDAYPR